MSRLGADPRGLARHLGRALREDEVVHHVDGVRTDNRLLNLELWSTAPPKGQRIEDEVAFGLLMLERYAPQLLADPPCDDERSSP